MGTDLAIRNADPIALGEVMHASGMFPDTTSAHQAVVKILAGQEYGLGPVAAMSGIHIIDKKPVPGATVLAGCTKRHPTYDYKVRAHDNTVCTLEFFERGGAVADSEVDGPIHAWHSLGISTFTIEDAKRAGLAGRKNWQNYPRNMLFARALTNGVRWYCPDVTATGVVLSAEEAADIADVDYVPAGAVPEPVRVENVAEADPATRPVSEGGLKALADVYERTGWKGEPEFKDEHHILRMQLAMAGAANDAADITDAMRSLTAAQAETVYAALSEAAEKRAEFERLAAETEPPA